MGQALAMDLADRLELHELPGRYGDAIDDRDWDRLEQIFTDDAVFHLTDLGAPLLEGLDRIKPSWTPKLTTPGPIR